MSDRSHCVHTVTVEFTFFAHTHTQFIYSLRIMTIIYFLQKKRNKHKFYIFSGRVNYAAVRDGALLAVIIGFLPVFGYLQLHSSGHVHAYYRQGTSCTRTNATKSVHKLHASLSIICIRRVHYIARVSVTQTYICNNVLLLHMENFKMLQNFAW